MEVCSFEMKDGGAVFTWPQSVEVSVVRNIMKEIQEGLYRVFIDKETLVNASIDYLDNGVYLYGYEDRDDLSNVMNILDTGICDHVMEHGLSL